MRRQARVGRRELRRRRERRSGAGSMGALVGLILWVGKVYS